MFAYSGRKLFIDLAKARAEKTPLHEKEAVDFLGGRGLNIAGLLEETPLDKEPLSAENTMYIGVGPLNGTSFPGAARVNFTARSPQTRILGDSNTGGDFGPEIKYAGYDQVILKGRSPRLVYLVITEEGVDFRDASHLSGLDTIQTQVAIKRELGDDRVQVAAIGPASENGVAFSGIFCTGVRAAARTGMGLVMASKNVKAVAVRGHGGVKVADPKSFEDRIGKIITAVREHEEYDIRRRLGTTKLVSALNSLGCLSTRHFQEGTFEHVDHVSGEALETRVKVKSRGCFSCTIPCSRVYTVQGPFETITGEGPEFEGLAGFSSRVGCKSLEFSLRCCDMCNRLGLDVISTSEVISFSQELLEKGMLSSSDTDGLELTWGNEESVMALIGKISRREGFGDVLADGVRRAAERLGQGKELAMHVKGLEIFQADPRGIKAYALGLAVASRGGDHLRSEPWFEFCEDGEEGMRRYGTPDAAFRLKTAGKGRVVKDFEERCALADCLNACKNTIVNMEILDFKSAAELLRDATGLDFCEEGIRLSMERIVNMERLYITKLGISRVDDRLPARFLEEPMPGSSPTSGSVVELDEMLDEYYEARGWDLETGRARPKTLERLGLVSDQV
ncbi:MAG: aldehyde ferredoxin oxidoreductase family protein [Thermovirgaceae bacterium]